MLPLCIIGTSMLLCINYTGERLAKSSRKCVSRTRGGPTLESVCRSSPCQKGGRCVSSSFRKRAAVCHRRLERREARNLKQEMRLQNPRRAHARTSPSFLSHSGPLFDTHLPPFRRPASLFSTHIGPIFDTQQSFLTHSGPVLDAQRSPFRHIAAPFSVHRSSSARTISPSISFPR